jgi:hypothetical protein
LKERWKEGRNDRGEGKMKKKTIGKVGKERMLGFERDRSMCRTPFGSCCDPVVRETLE